MSAGFICLILSCLCFALATFAGAVPFVALVPLGLFFLVLAYLLGGSWPRPA